MAEELKHLIEQIHKEGVEKAKEQGKTLLSSLFRSPRPVTSVLPQMRA